jgi:hypothetical protein
MTPASMEVLDRRDNLTIARAIYRGRVQQFLRAGWPCCAIERGVLARSDRPETMPR